MFRFRNGRTSSTGLGCGGAWPGMVAWHNVVAVAAMLFVTMRSLVLLLWRLKCCGYPCGSLVLMLLVVVVVVIIVVVVGFVVIVVVVVLRVVVVAIAVVAVGL